MRPKRTVAPMHLTPSNLLPKPWAGTQEEKRIPPPAFLRRDLQCDWNLATTVYANLLLVGSSSETAIMLDALGPHFRGPICRFRPKAGVVLPERSAGTLIVLEVNHLDSKQQAQMLRWIHQPQRHAQVVCTASESLFRLVEAGDFLPELYYRLNVVLLDLTPS